MNKQGFQLMEESYGLLKFLDFLEKQCGGQGNGIVLVKDNAILHIEKGMALANKEIVDIVRGNDFDYFMYHTRVASAGSVKDKNCHPFWNDDNSFALMMNGTESGMAQLARPLDITDTELIFNMIDRDVIPVDSLKLFTANYMGFYEGEVFLCNNKTYDPLVVYKEDDAFIIASDFPADKLFKSSYELKYGFWKQDEELKKKEPIKRELWNSRKQSDGWLSVINHPIDERYELELEKGLYD